MASEQGGFWLAVGVMLIGLVGGLLPGIPGVGLIWVAALVYGLSTGFSSLSPWVFAVITVLGLVGATADIWVSNASGRATGASWGALLAGTVLGFVGMGVGFLFLGIGAVPGALIGSLAGVLLVEYRRRREWEGALKAGAGWLVGYVVSAIVEFMLGLVMVLLFVWQAWPGR